MLKNQDTRASTSTTDLLLASLLELQHAYENMRLPDFFFGAFNHLQRYKEGWGSKGAWEPENVKIKEASKIAEKIAEILNDPSSVLEELGTKQKVFREEQEKRAGKALRELGSFNGEDTEEWVEMVRRLKVELSSASLTQAFIWMETKWRATLEKTNECVWEIESCLLSSIPDPLVEETKR